MLGCGFALSGWGRGALVALGALGALVALGALGAQGAQGAPAVNKEGLAFPRSEARAATEVHQDAGRMQAGAGLHWRSQQQWVSMWAFSHFTICL